MDAAVITIAEQEKLLKLARSRLQRRSTPLPPVTPVGRDEPPPVSFAQRRMWFLEQLGSAGRAFHISTRVRLKGEVDREALRRALIRIVERHEALRTVFHAVDGEPVQRILPVEESRFPLLEHDAAGDAAAGAEPRPSAEADAPFDLERGPLVRARLLRLGEDDHLLVVGMHHIVSDGWSMEVFNRELGTLYAAFRRGEPDPLPPLPVQYADFAAWQRQWLTGEVLERQLSWWRERLAGAPPLLELPMERPRPPVQTYRGAACSLYLSPSLSRRIHALSQREGATLFMTLLAAFDVLLARYSGQSDVVVGTPIANRTRAETEGLIGFFLNTLPLRTDLSGDPSFRQLLARVRETALGAYAHQDIPFEHLLAELDPPRSLSHSPVFQMMFNLLNFRAGRPAEPSAAAPVPPGAEGGRVAKFDLELYASEEPQGIRLRLVYNRDLFEAERMRELLRHLEVLLEGAVAAPDRRISELPLLSEEERLRRAARGPRVRIQHPFREFAREEIEQTLHARFERQARLHPQRVAVRSRRHTLTYAELDRAADRVARVLRAPRPAGEERVALLFEHDAPMIVGILGALKAGKTYVPLDPLYPHERVAFILEDSGASAILTNGANLARARELAGGRIPVVDVDAPEPDGAGAASPGPVHPGSPAYILYTSGSTGRPKGVVQSHRNVLHHIRVYTNNLHISADDTLTLLSSYTFDAAVMAIYGALLNGATLCPFDWREDAAMGIAGWIREAGITLYHSTPTVYRSLVEGLGETEVFPRVRRVVLGGEEVQARDVERFRAHFPRGCVLVNGLGPTESTVTLQNFLDHDTPVERTSVSVGYPVEDTEVVLRNEVGEQVAVHGLGEIVIRSPHVALGYWGRPELTAAAFSADGERGGRRSYRTGDLGRLLPDGGIEYVGRRDFQVKIRGHRVEVGEIEVRLREAGWFREAVVVAREQGPGDRVLVAYLVPGEGAPAPDAAGLRARLSEHLPGYMVPAAFVVLERLPLTPSGKVDRQALPAPERTAADPEAFTAPRTAVEEALCRIWEEVLRVERVGIHDSFFELGGHSLLATRVVARVRQVLGVELPLRALFESPTVAGLGARVEAAKTEALGTLPAILGRAQAARDTRFPLSFAQQRLWFLYRMAPESSAYNLHRVLRMRGPLHPDALHRAPTELVRRHESLRTRFQEADGEPAQVIAAPPPVHPPVVDLRGLPAERRAEAARLVAADAAAPFDLAAGPPLRVRVVWLEEEEWAVHLIVHHIAADGWSMGLLLRELSALYDAFSRGEPSPLPEPALQYADFAVWQRDWLRGEVMGRQLAWWTERLAGVPPLLELPTDRPRPAVLRGESASVGFVLPAELTRALRALAGREGATLFMVVLAGLQTLLARYSGQDVVAVGTPVAGRTRVELESLVGFFVNTLVLTADLSADPPFRELLGQVREATLGAHAHQDVPFEKLVEELRVEPSLNHTPLYQVMLAFQNVEQGVPERAAAEPGSARRGRDTATTDLSLTLRERGEHLAGSLAYRTELFDAATVERMLGHLTVLLEGIAADPARRVSELPLLPEAERRRVLEEWNATAAPYPVEACIHEMFEARAARAPHATAVVLGGEALTYAELDRRAESVASALAARGIGRGDYVPILMERSLGVPVAMLGVMKSGAAFSPLDVRWPAARLRQVLDDLGCDVVLVDGTTPFDAEAPGRTLLDVRDAAGAEDARPRPSVRVAPEDPVYAIYTSGSTGTPKGVLVPHRGIANRFLWMSDHFGPRAAEVVLQTTRHVYDSAVWQLFWPLTLGGRSVMLRGDEELAAEPTAALVREHGVTMTDFVPSVFNELVPRLVADAGMRSALASLRVVVVGGEQITAATAYTFRERFPAARVINLYGPTEASIGCICHEVTGREGERIPIGRPIANTHALVLDRHRGLVPVGVPGELYLSGACLGLGYLNDGEKTRAAFVENPFPELRCERMYRTGDRVRWRADGELEFLGRTDHQVKIRGFRIEPGEVEAALLRHPGVREALVLAHEVAPGERRLVAYVAADGQEGVAAAGLRAHLGAHLPEYMVPAAFVVLEQLPRTPGGKTDRAALPAPAWAGGAAYVAPRTPLEEILAEIWAGVLNRERVGVHDGFFELGGHSLLAIRVIARVREAFGVEVPLRALFERPTVARLGETVQAAVSAGEGARPVPLRRVPREGELPLSFGQERLWSAYRAEPGSTSFNLQHRLRLRGRVEPRALERALTEVVRRHEVLRTVFRMTGERAVQVIHPAGPVRLREVDLAGLAEAAREEAVRSLAAGEARRPFDLERGPLIRVVLARMGEEDFGLVLSLHHIVTDGWSTGVLMREISILYEAFAAGRESPLPEPEVQYADYAAWQRTWLSEEVMERQLAYWRARLAGAPRLLTLRTDRPRPPVRSDRAAVHRLRLPEEVSRGLRSLGRREGCTLYMVLLAGFQALLSRHSGQEDVCVGTPIAGRMLREVESLIGFFTNTLVIRADLSGSPTFRGLLSRVREAILGAYAHQDFPFARLVAELRPECGPGGMPLFQAVFELEHARSRGERLRLPEVEPGALGRSPEDWGSLRSELRLTMVDDGDRVDGSLAYRTELFDPATIERMAADYLALLAGAAADPDRPLANLFPAADAPPAGSRTAKRSPAPSPGGRVALRGEG